LGHLAPEHCRHPRVGDALNFPLARSRLGAHGDGVEVKSHNRNHDQSAVRPARPGATLGVGFSPHGSAALNRKVEMSKLESVFLPPDVQIKLSERLGTIPRQLPPAAVAQIDALWMRRNQCQESEIDGIDKQMEEIAVSATK
jgi:hypothetical protein